MTKERFKLMPAVWLIFKKDNKILLLKRKNTGWEDGNYAIPAGKLDGKETVTQAAIREAREELGLNINETNLDVAHVLHKINYDNEETIDFFLNVSDWQGIPENTEPHKCEELKWFEVDNFPENMVGCLRHVLKKLEKNIFYSEFGWE